MVNSSTIETRRLEDTVNGNSDFQNEATFMHFPLIVKEYEKFKHYRESPSPSIPWREILLIAGYRNVTEVLLHICNL